MILKEGHWNLICSFIPDLRYALKNHFGKPPVDFLGKIGSESGVWGMEFGVWRTPDSEIAVGPTSHDWVHDWVGYVGATFRDNPSTPFIETSNLSFYLKTTLRDLLKNFPRIIILYPRFRFQTKEQILLFKNAGGSSGNCWWDDQPFYWICSRYGPISPTHITARNQQQNPETSSSPGDCRVSSKACK